MSNKRKTIHKRLEQMHRNSEVTELDRDGKTGMLPLEIAKRDKRRARAIRLQTALRTRQINALYADMAKNKENDRHFLPKEAGVHTMKEKVS